jgi:hypothetical protein
MTAAAMTVFIVIRRCTDDGHEFADVDAASASPEFALKKAERAATELPAWHKANPVVAVAQFNYVAARYL